EFHSSSHIFVVTTLSVHLVSIQSNTTSIIGNASGIVNKTLGDPVASEIDSRGCKPGCCTILEPRREDKESKEQQFVIGCDSAVYLYHMEGVGPCLAFEADKELITCFRNYLICVVRDNDKTILNIYDLQNKYVAYSTPLANISHVLPHWGGGELVVVTKQGKLFSLSEKSTEDRLGVLVCKNQYELAVKLAKSNKYDGIVEIFRQYGDHLYAKGDHDGAVAQYIKTIGKLEESYVIRKLLDAQKIKQLTEYLQELHKTDLAREDHTTLLLNCYTNINQVDTLSEFIKRSDLQFDVEIAIKVCRGSQLYTEALYLAEKHKLTDYYLKIQLENLRNFDDAIYYIERLSFQQAEENMEKYGKVLMDHSPQKTTNLLSRLCTNFDGRKSPAEKFIHIFVGKPRLLKNFLQQIIAELGDKVGLSSIIYNTLLELELQEYMVETHPSQRSVKEVEIMCFLREKKNCYDTDLALGLCQINNFKPGILHLYEKAELYHQILSFYTDKQDYAGIIDVCSRFGDSDPSLWLHALLVLTGADEHGDMKQYFMSVLGHIEKHSLLPAILVVSIAARSKTAPLSLVKEFLVRQLSADGDKIRSCEQTIKQLKKETEQIREQMENIKHKPHVFQESKCSGCKIELELPTVHFLCGHSFHVNCFENFGDHNEGCPSCAPENNRIVEQQRRMDEAMMTLDNDFTRCFANSDDVMATVADFFAKGVFKTFDLWTEATLNNTNDYVAIHNTAVKRNIFEKPSPFPGRVVEMVAPLKKSILDKPGTFEKVESAEVPVVPSLWGKTEAPACSAPVKNPVFDNPLKVARSSEDDCMNNPFSESIPTKIVEDNGAKKENPQYLTFTSKPPNSAMQPTRSSKPSPLGSSGTKTIRESDMKANTGKNPFGDDEELNKNEKNPFKQGSSGNPFGDDFESRI
ncbi:vacuolar protein sorting-associated protein 11-like, partial [Tropilaelaps mercedesae]